MSIKLMSLFIFLVKGARVPSLHLLQYACSLIKLSHIGISLIISPNIFRFISPSRPHTTTCL